MSVSDFATAAPARSRRDFLAISAAAAGAALSGAPRLALADDGDPYGGFRMGLQTYSLRGFSFADAIAKVQELGLHHVELFSGHLGHQKPYNTDVEAGRKLLADHGVVADAYGVSPFSKDEAANRRIFEFGKAMGLRVLTADPAEDSFDVLDKLVEEYGIAIGIHNHGPHHKWGKPEVILAAVKDHHPKIGLCADTGHFLRAGVDPVEAIRILKGRVFAFHVKDFVDEKTEMVAGDGKLDLVALFREARAQKFDGPCSLEYELTPDAPMDGLRKGLENVKKAIASI